MLDFPVGATVSEGLLVQAELLQWLADRNRLSPSFRRPVGLLCRAETHRDAVCTTLY
jgi:hypothetical protein